MTTLDNPLPKHKLLTKHGHLSLVNEQDTASLSSYLSGTALNVRHQCLCDIIMMSNDVILKLLIFYLC